jgi:glycine cleavage system H protein
MYPDEFKYTREHEWVKLEGELGVVGITFHAQQALGDIVYVELPKVGSQAVQGKAIGTVESVKAVSDIYAPVSGEVVEVNEALTQTPELLNRDPHGEAWLAKIRLSAPEELERLLSAAQYRDLVAEES